MTARDTLLPAVVSHDGLDLQRFMGVTQSIEGLTVIEALPSPRWAWAFWAPRIRSGLRRPFRSQRRR